MILLNFTKNIMKIALNYECFTKIDKIAKSTRKLLTQITEHFLIHGDFQF